MGQKDEEALHLGAIFTAGGKLSKEVASNAESYALESLLDFNGLKRRENIIGRGFSISFEARLKLLP